MGFKEVVHTVSMCNVLDSRVGKTHVDDNLQLEHVLYCLEKKGYLAHISQMGI
jgi:hypothetical protein